MPSRSSRQYELIVVYVILFGLLGFVVWLFVTVINPGLTRIVQVLGTN